MEEIGLDRARDFHFVKQLPRTTIPEVEWEERVYDRQVLLNESWSHYCSRRGYSAEQASEEHVKWVTETWEEWEARVPHRDQAVADFFADQQSKEEQTEAEKKQRLQRSNQCIEMMMQKERDYLSKKLPVLHTLYVDFEEELLKKHARERADMEAEELRDRHAKEEEEAEARRQFEMLFDENLKKVLALLEERRKAQEEEEERIRQEQKRKADELRRAEEEKQKATEEAERKKREAEEEAKRAERRKKEEERKAKARAEREARTAAARGQTRTATQEEQRDASRKARLHRMDGDMEAYLQKLRAECDAASTHAALRTIMQRVVTQDLSPEVLFHSAVYLGDVVSEKGESVLLRYVWASQNCSPKLKSGEAVLGQQNAEDGLTPLTIESCVVRERSTGIIKNCQNQLAFIGDWPMEPNEKPTGDYLGVPIVLTKKNADDGEEKQVVSVLACDTLNNNALDVTSSFKAGEERVYAHEEKEPSVAHVGMTDNQGRFLEAIGDILSESISRIANAPPATSEETAEKTEEEIGKSNLNFPPTVNSIPAMWNAVTAAIHGMEVPESGSKIQCYISRLHRPNGNECTVVAHNGISLSDPARHSSSTPCHLLGMSLTNASALTFQGFLQLHDQDGLSAGFLSPEPSHIYAPNVTQDARCLPYSAGSEKAQECLLLVPLKDNRGKMLCMCGVSYNAPPGLTDSQIQEILEFLKRVQQKVLLLLLQQSAAQLCNQAIEWLALTTGVQNVYVSLKSSLFTPELASSDQLQYVAASAAQKWLVGKNWSSKDAFGISHVIMEQSSPTAPQLRHIPHISGYKETSANGEERDVHLWNDAATKDFDGALLTTAITNKQGVHGVIYADTVGADGKGQKMDFTKGDEEIIKTTAFLLGEVLLDCISGQANPELASSPIAQRVLSIEKLVAEEEIQFLKRVWIKVTSDIQQITKDQLLEMSRYNSPPPIIPVTCQATFIVLGTKPKAVEKWEDMRKKIKMPLLEKIVAYDPTGTKVRKPFFQRARKLTKGYTADDVFTKGSYPASCFFTWTFVTILLRKAADQLRKRVKEGLFDTNEVEGELSSVAATDETLDTEDQGALDEGDDPVEEDETTE